MGLIKAALGAAGGVLADQWKEFFYCDALDMNTLMVKGQKRTSGRSSNTKGEENLISNGSVIAVADGQAMIIVEQGKIVEFCAEPGEFTWDASTEPSIFAGSLGDSIKDTFRAIGKRFTFGGDTGKDQRVYYFNTKEISGNKYGTANPVPFRVVVNEELGFKLSVDIRCNGEYSYKIVDPMLFYTNVCGNSAQSFDRSEIDSILKSELLNALQPALAKLSAAGVQYYEIPAHTFDIRDALNEVLDREWGEKRGLEVFSFNVNSLTIPDEQKKKITEWEENAMTMNPMVAGSRLVGAQADAMRTAAANEGGAMQGFMGMGMAMNAGGMNAQNLFAMGQQQQQQAETQRIPTQQADPVPMGWKCSCGATATGKFCPECGAKKPEEKPANAWTCKCGATATGKFCPECGSPKPADEGWTCSCGAVNKGKFCPECGAKKPAGVPQYKCDKCGWEPEKGVKPPKFCPECGDPFDNGDII
ncbi:MAG: SPFH domain-containing protein [Ruminococcaceae bacterium]|nr:SPFH domain-containing protein [Oscillospiraceae bacterium]